MLFLVFASDDFQSCWLQTNRVRALRKAIPIENSMTVKALPNNYSIFLAAPNIKVDNRSIKLMIKFGLAIELARHSLRVKHWEGAFFSFSP